MELTIDGCTREGVRAMHTRTRGPTTNHQQPSTNNAPTSANRRARKPPQTPHNIHKHTTTNQPTLGIHSGASLRAHAVGLDGGSLP